MHKQLPFLKRVEILNFVKTVGKLNGEYWEYNEGWSDERIANNYHVGKANVTGIRKELGNIKSPTAHLVGPRISKLDTEILVIKGTIEAWENAVKELERKINYLENLALSHGWRFKERV